MEQQRIRRWTRTRERRRGREMTTGTEQVMEIRYCNSVSERVIERSICVTGWASRSVETGYNGKRLQGGRFFLLLGSGFSFLQQAASLFPFLSTLSSPPPPHTSLPPRLRPRCGDKQQPYHPFCPCLVWVSSFFVSFLFCSCLRLLGHDDTKKESSTAGYGMAH